MKTCSKHKKYSGKRKPKTECFECLAIYIELHKTPRILLPPNEVFKDKTKYTRKNKHKLKKD